MSPTTTNLTLPIAVTRTLRTWTASLGKLQGTGATRREALTDLGMLLTNLAAHTGDEAAFATDHNGDHIAAVPDGTGGSTEYRINPTGARLTAHCAAPPAVYLRQVPHYDPLPTR